MSSLTCKFTESCKQPDGETLVKIRDHYFADAVMNEKESPNTGGLNIPHADVIEAIKDRKKREEYAKYIATSLKLLNDRLDAIEDELIRNHGEDFAAHLAVDHLDNETYKHIMAIQDTEERRHEFAVAINEGLENGTIKKDAFKDNPEFKEWLDVRKEIKQQRTLSTNVDSEISELKIQENHNVTEKNEEDVFDSIFANESPVTI